MKKIGKIVVLMLSALLLTSCGNQKESVDLSGEIDKNVNELQDDTS